MEKSFVQRPLWRLANMLACFQCILRCFVSCSHCAVDPWLQFQLVVWHVVEGGVAVGVVAACGSSSATSTFAKCAAARHVPDFPLIIRRCVVWSFFFISSVIVHVPDPYRSDGATVPSKSLSLSLGGYLGDVNSCQWLVNDAHAHLMWSNSTRTALLKVVSWPRYLILPPGGRTSMFIPWTATVLPLPRFDVV